MSDFQYEPLLESDSIRLLLLEPSSDLSYDIHCRLLHTSLAQCNDEIIDQYTALSYVWGDPKSQKKIYVNGQTVYITLNLFHALRDLRDAERVHRLWVDAICINQSDHPERNRQVGLMDSIYSMAQHTVIYLGERSVRSDAVLKLLRGSPEESDARPGLLALVEREILARPWFTRVWIFQELVLSRDPRIQLGTARLRWDDFCNHVERLRGNRAPTRNPPLLPGCSSVLHEKPHDIFLMVSISQAARNQSGDQQSSEDSSLPVDAQVRQRDYSKVLQNMQATRKLFRTKQLKPEERIPSILDILLARRGFGATDARDMIFGHLGIAVDSAKELGISADYDISAAELFTKVARSFIVHSKDLEILFHIQDVEPSLRRSGLPSWVPDWTSTEFHDFHFISLWEETLLKWIGASSKFMMGILANHPLFKIWDEEPSVLALEGWNLCSIVATSPIILQNNCEFDSDTNSLWSPELDLKDLPVIYPEIYNAWRRTSGFGLLPPFEVYKLAAACEFNHILHLFPNMEEADSGSYNEWSIASLLVLHTFGDKLTTRSCSLSGRRIATLSNGRIAIVPGSTLPGDFVCRFEEYLAHWILRNKDDAPSHSALGCQVVNKFKGHVGNSNHRSMTEEEKRLLPEKTLTHAVFIGESFVDYTIGRSMREEKELRAHSIFIIH